MEEAHWVPRQRRKENRRKAVALSAFGLLREKPVETRLNTRRRNPTFDRYSHHLRWTIWLRSALAEKSEANGAEGGLG